MKTMQTNKILWSLCLLAFFANCGNAWSASTPCKFLKSGARMGGSGIGGTGDAARGSGIGGTGARPESDSNLIQIAGTVSDSTGFVVARRSGGTRPLSKNDPVCVGETIVTSKSAKTRIVMADGALVEIRAQSKLTIEKYTFDQPGMNGSLLALNDGSARFVTGRIGKENPQDVLIKTPTATIGVHGTDHEATVILEGTKSEYAAGTYDKVNSGVTYIRTALGEIDIQPNQVGFAASTAEPPALLHDMPAFYHAEPSFSVKESPQSANHVEGAESAQHSHTDHAVETPEPLDPMEHDHSIMESHDIGDLPEPPELQEPPELPRQVDE